jgi:hypothetical protein
MMKALIQPLEYFIGRNIDDEVLFYIKKAIPGRKAALPGIASPSSI